MPGFEEYYEEELRYLREAGQEFAEAFPDRARYLNLTTLEDRDPYVERLFEGFAFLSGRIRQKLDDDFPEFARNLLEMIDPLFLRAIPSLCMVEFRFQESLLARPHVLPPGTTLLTNPVGREMTVCRFRTTKPVRLMPVRLENVEAVHHASLGDGMRFDFRIDAAAELVPEDWGELPVYLHGERPLAYFLHEFLTAKVAQVFLEVPGQAAAIGGPELLTPGGFGEDENLLPPIDSSFEGSRFLLEFFAFDEKFRFVNFDLRPLSGRVLGENFTLKVHFREGLPEGRRFGTPNFRLHASPAVNLFPLRAEPIVLDQHHFEYSVTPEANRRTETYEVVGITGVDKATGRHHPYHKFSDFRVPAVAKGAAEGYFQARQEPNAKGRWTTYLTLGRYGERNTFEEEYLSVEILAFQNGVPREDMTEGALSSATPDFPAFAEFSNFTRPTPPIYPPKYEHSLWYLLAHLNMNFRSLCQPDVLKEVLSLYDWTRSAPNRKILDGVVSATARKRHFPLGSQLTAGTEVVVEVRDEAFAEGGERLLFGRVLLEFLSQYTSINHRVSLRLIQVPSGRETEFQPRDGRCHPL